MGDVLSTSDLADRSSAMIRAVYAQLAPVTLRDAIDRLPTVGAAT